MNTIAALILIGAVSPDDYAYGMELTPGDDAPVQSMVMSPVHYRGVTRPDVSDLAVFDADQRPVPHALRSLDAPPSPPEEIEISPFPILGTADSPLNDIAVRVTRSENGAIQSIELESEDSESSILRGYLFDLEAAGAAGRGISYLRFLEPDGEKSFITAVTLESSEDLTEWRALTQSQTVAHLNYDTRRLKRLRVPLFNRTARYLRLSWRNPGPAPEFAGVRIGVSGPRPAVERETLNVASTRSDGGFDFDLGGPIPVDRLELAGLEENTVAEVSWFSRPSLDSEWHRRADGLVYSVFSNDVLLKSDAQSVSPTRDRYWRLEVSSKGGGLGRIWPQLEVRWVPEQLVFVRRGSPPFTLAFGSARVEPEDFSAAKLLAMIPESTALAAETVSVGPRLKKNGATRVGIWGFSLGTGVAVELAARHDEAFLILDAPFDS
ncbi:MAG: DUF3999 family protein, partial [Myxococcota bacterium]